MGFFGFFWVVFFGWVFCLPTLTTTHKFPSLVLPQVVLFDRGVLAQVAAQQCVSVRLTQVLVQKLAVGLVTGTKPTGQLLLPVSQDVLVTLTLMFTQVTETRKLGLVAARTLVTGQLDRHMFTLPV